MTKEEYEYMGGLISQIDRLSNYMGDVDKFLFDFNCLGRDIKSSLDKVLSESEIKEIIESIENKVRFKLDILEIELEGLKVTGHPNTHDHRVPKIPPNTKPIVKKGI